VRSIIALCLMLHCVTALLAQTPVFSSTTNLQSIAVQVVDKKGTFVPGLTVNDFTLLENGHPQKIAFFGAEQQPASVAILLDSSRSMDFGRKFDRARELLAPLFTGHDPKDQIFFMPFTDRIESFTQLTPEQRQHPELIRSSRAGGERGTALYDALASALCRMRTAGNLRQGVVVITDGADQHSRLTLEQLIQLAQMSTPQIFMVGFFDRDEADLYHERDKTITLLGEREIDNPVIVFDRLAKESGAESFFPSSEQDLKKALDRIEELLQAQYTLSYYPQNAERFRKIDVRVHGGGVKVIARRGVGSSAEGGAVHFDASTCEVSAKDTPYPWEPKTVRTISGDLLYHEDFSDPKSGWPNHRETIPAVPHASLRLQASPTAGEYKPGLRYVPGGYEISYHPPAELVTTGPISDGVVAAYGPSWNDVRASVSIDADLGRSISSGDALSYANAASLVFHLSQEGFYALMLTGGRSARSIQFKLAKRPLVGGGSAAPSDLIPWTTVEPQGGASKNAHTVAVEYKHGRIAVFVDDKQVASVSDNSFTSGLVGLGFFGKGNAMFRDLMVQDAH
jgi:Ca-activated chloride channel family protein